MLNYEKDKEEIIARMDFLPDDPQVRENLLIALLKLLVFN